MESLLNPISPVYLEWLENFINDTTGIDGASVEGTALTMPITQAQIDARCVGQADDQYTVNMTF